jgi:hypothetical protein
MNPDLQRLLRRLRGAIGMGLTWAVAWGLLGGVPRWILGMESDLPFPILFAMLGFAAGMGFTGVLAALEGRRRFDELSATRFAAWGAAIGGVMAAAFVRGTPLAWPAMLGIGATFVVACAGSAAASLALARRASREQLASGGTPALGDAGVPTGEAR